MAKRYYQRDYEEAFYIFDSKVLSEKEFDERIEYDSYEVFADSLTGTEILKLLNENAELKNDYKTLQLQYNDCEQYCKEIKQEVKSLKQVNSQLSIIGEKQADFIMSKGFTVHELIDFARDGSNDRK